MSRQLIYYPIKNKTAHRYPQYYTLPLYCSVKGFLCFKSNNAFVVWSILYWDIYVFPYQDQVQSIPRCLVLVCKKDSIAYRAINRTNYLLKKIRNENAFWIQKGLKKRASFSQYWSHVKAVTSTNSTEWEVTFLLRALWSCPHVTVFRAYWSSTRNL